MYTKEERWEMVYEGRDGTIKRCYPRTKDKVKENKEKLSELGLKLVSCTKLYPFNTYKNQHNFMLIDNICYNRMHDMEDGEAEYDQEEYDRLYELQQKAERFFLMPLPIALVSWDDWKEMKEMSENAIIHRQNACIEAGRYDLVQYC